MVVDFKLFAPGEPLRPDLLWVIEEMPGLLMGCDCTGTLASGYWPSYNVPCGPQIFNKSGYAAMAASHGNYFSYELAPRAKLFRRDHSSVVDMASLKSLMRYNDYLRDPYFVDSTGSPNPNYAICARGDLGTRAGQLPDAMAPRSHHTARVLRSCEPRPSTDLRAQWDEAICHLSLGTASGSRLKHT
ncbi:unnamed protein product [Polarella glacialis]|uniref:Phospholipase B-like n=1 Tax=Polarella glacialis TaxID=89957 RepID=A0A813H3L4_POLGL|nr:unnamed protein product [Polarella glacialis]